MNQANKHSRNRLNKQSTGPTTNWTKKQKQTNNQIPNHENNQATNQSSNRVGKQSHSIIQPHK